MQFKIKQWFVLLLALTMTFMILPATALAESVTPTEETKVEQVQAMIDELPEAEEITAENRNDVQAQIDTIDEALAELVEEETGALDTTRYDAVVAALSALDAQNADPDPEPSTVEQVQTLIDALPEAEEITAENRADVQTQIDAIDAAMLELTEDQAATLDTARYDEAAAALLALVTPSALEQVQALLNALPDAEDINEDNRADVEAQLGAIDEAKLELTDDEMDELDISRYLAAVEALLALDDMAGADEPTPIAFLDDLSGNGSSDSPYQISTAEQLRQLSEYVNAGNNCQNIYFQLAADIDLGGSADNQWTPIGNESNKFQGTFDGDGHTVSGLYIDSFDYNLGLFGCVDGGTVKNLGVSGYIKGSSNSYVGGIAGWSTGTITGCNSACKIEGGDFAGGIVGRNQGSVSDCYNTGSISGADRAGGIAGNNSRNISNCYNAGAVSGEDYAGGIVGNNAGGSITNSYNVGEVTGTGSRGGIAGNDDGHGTYTKCYFLGGPGDNGVGSGSATGVEQKSEEEFRALASTLGADEWTDDPFLGRPVLNDNQEPSPVSGQGTEVAPYLIPDKATLEKIRDYIKNDPDHGKDQFFKLTKNIDLGGEEWTPIGEEFAEFNGTFDGDNHTISGLYINDSAGEYLGLFGSVGENGAVKNLVVSGSVTGKSYVGGIAGSCKGTVTNSRNDAIVSGEDNVGGIVGKIESGYNGKVTGCCNTGTITGRSGDVGGVVGDGGYNSQITNCCNTGVVTGDNNGVGGVVGDISNGSVSNCYNTGTVTSPGNTAKGVCGLLYNSTVTNCYYLNTAPADSDATSKTVEQFASGEVAWLLQKDQGTQVWGQTVGNGTPELTDSPEKKVYQITGKVEDQDDVVWYSNSFASLPAAPSKAGFAFAGWSTAVERTEADFVKDFPVSVDMIVYAVFTDKKADNTENPKATNETDAIHSTAQSPSPIAVDRKTGNLTVTVTDTGENADSTQQWHFRVELDNKTIGGEYGDMRFTDGVAEFTLQSVQSLTARDLPEGAAYTVTELNGNQNGYVTTCSNDRGIITSKQDMVAAFVNDKSVPAQPDNPSDTPTESEPGNTSKTGDESPLLLWLSLMILSLIGITAIVRTSITGRKKPVSTNGGHIRK